jgi:hypothetical protein
MKYRRNGRPDFDHIGTCDFSVVLRRERQRASKGDELVNAA